MSLRPSIRMNKILAAFVLILVALTKRAEAACPYASVQARVQFNISTPWQQAISLNLGQTFNVAGFHDNFDQLVTLNSNITLTVRQPNGALLPANTNPATFSASMAGTYQVQVNCQGLTSNIATVVASGLPTTAYDMYDYMRNDTADETNVLHVVYPPTPPGQPVPEQHFRNYEIGNSRFFITKNNDTTFFPIQFASEYEEFTYDQNYIYLIRDTSWQPVNWCKVGLAPTDTQFELWSNGVNRGAWIPRFVLHGNTYVTGPFDVRSRLEGGTCQVCTNSDSTGLGQSRTIVVTHHAAAPFNPSLPDVIELRVIMGPGMGERYYFSKTKGWVGYTETDSQGQLRTASYLDHFARPFALTVRDSCPIKNPDMETEASQQFGPILNFGPNGGWANHSEHRTHIPPSLSPGLIFGFYAAGTMEAVHQRLDICYVANKTYTFRAFVHGGLDNSGTVQIELGYADSKFNSNTWRPLQGATFSVNANWQQVSVSYTPQAGAPSVNKQVMIRFPPGSPGRSDIWFDNLELVRPSDVSGVCP